MVKKVVRRFMKRTKKQGVDCFGELGLISIGSPSNQDHSLHTQRYGYDLHYLQKGHKVPPF